MEIVNYWECFLICRFTARALRLKGFSVLFQMRRGRIVEAYRGMMWFHAFAAFLQRVQVIRFAKWFAIQSIKGFSLQKTITLMAGETGDVIQPAHG